MLRAEAFCYINLVVVIISVIAIPTVSADTDVTYILNVDRSNGTVIGEIHFNNIELHKYNLLFLGWYDREFKILDHSDNVDITVHGDELEIVISDKSSATITYSVENLRSEHENESYIGYPYTWFELGAVAPLPWNCDSPINLTVIIKSDSKVFALYMISSSAINIKVPKVKYWPDYISENVLVLIGDYKVFKTPCGIKILYTDGVPEGHVYELSDFVCQYYQRLVESMGLPRTPLEIVALFDTKYMLREDRGGQASGGIWCRYALDYCRMDKDEFFKSNVIPSIAHETVHQWIGHTVSSKDAIFSEGFTEYVSLKNTMLVLGFDKFKEYGIIDYVKGRIGHYQTDDPYGYGGAIAMTLDYISHAMENRSIEEFIRYLIENEYCWFDSFHDILNLYLDWMNVYDHEDRSIITEIAMKPPMTDQIVNSRYPYLDTVYIDHILKQIIEKRKSLQVSIVTDKEEYTPGEVMLVNITITNPTDKTWDVLFSWWVTIPSKRYCTIPIRIERLKIPPKYNMTFAYPITVGYWKTSSFGAVFCVALTNLSTGKIISFDATYWNYQLTESAKVTAIQSPSWMR